jgi:hypothetical protein
VIGLGKKCHNADPKKPLRSGAVRSKSPINSRTGTSVPKATSSKKKIANQEPTYLFIAIKNRLGPYNIQTEDGPMIVDPKNPESVEDAISR